MKKSRILNKYLNEALADMGHGDILVVSDAGFPIPTDAQRVDVALEADRPSIVELLDLIMSDFIYEKVLVAEEQKAYNPLLHRRIVEAATRCPVETIPHGEFIKAMPTQAKYIVRTGSFEPWGNVALWSGVDAPLWFKKPGTITPGYYEARASFKDEK